MKTNLSITCILGLLAILLGAFAAHALKEHLSSDALQSFETAVRYQMYHVIVLLFVNTYQGFSSKSRNTISYIFFLGILFFSGSIYVIHLLSVDPKGIWFITPLGGIFFIIGWILLFISFLKKIIIKVNFKRFR